MGSKLVGVLKKTLRWFFTGQMLKNLKKSGFLNGKTDGSGKKTRNGSGKENGGGKGNGGGNGKRFRP
jgi:hypothetical protein